jgi:hypothetical protein
MTVLGQGQLADNPVCAPARHARPSNPTAPVATVVVPGVSRSPPAEPGSTPSTPTPSTAPPLAPATTPNQPLLGPPAAKIMSSDPRRYLPSAATLEAAGRLQADGFWLIDAVDRPVNHLPPGPRRAAITAAVPQLVARCCDLKPHRGVVICHRVVYQLTVPDLRAAGVPVLHAQPLPFPLGNWRADFAARARPGPGLR